MGMTNLYPNLPGHLVEFKDGGLQLVQTDDVESGAKSMLIIGTAYDGPVMEPVRIDYDTVSALFGSEVDENGYPNGATLTKYAKQAFRNGIRDVRCMRATGKQAEVTLSKIAETLEYDEDVIIPDTVVTGNDPASVTVEGPIYLDAEAGYTVSIKRIESGVPSTAYGYSSITPTDGTINFRAGLMPAGSQVSIEYHKLSFEHKDKTQTGAIPEVSESSGTVDTDAEVKIELTDFADEDVNNHVFYYKTGLIPGLTPGSDGVPDIDSTYTTSYPEVILKKTSGSSEEVTLVEGTDYDIITESDKKVYIKLKLDNAATFDSDSVNGDIEVKYETFKAPVVTETRTLSGSNIVISVPEPALINVNAVFKGTTTPVSFTSSVVDGHTEITIDQTGMDILQMISITAQKHVIEDITQSFTVRSIYGGEVYNYATVIVEDPDPALGKPEGTKKITFHKPAVPTTDASGATTFTYPKNYGSADLPFFWYSDVIRTVGALKSELRNYNLNNVFEIVCDDDDMTLDDLVNVVASLEGGSDGVNPTADEMFEALSGKRYRSADVDSVIDGVTVTEDMVGYLREQGCYQLLENYHVDYVYVAGVYAGMKSAVAKEFNTSFHHELCLLCAVLTYRTKMTHGFIDAKQNTNTTLKGVQKYVNELMMYNNLHYMQDSQGNAIVDSDGSMMDIGWYTSLVVGPAPIMTSDTLGTYYGSPSIAYAALCSKLAVQSAPTNKALPNVNGMAYKMSNKQMDALTANHMVVFKNKGEGMTTATAVPYVVDGCTCGGPDCDYQRISTVKIVTDVIDQIREVADPFLGEPNTIEQRNALAALISKRLSRILELGEIMDYEFEINATLQQVLIGECSISLVLSVPMELRRITTVVALRAAA